MIESIFSSGNIILVGSIIMLFAIIAAKSSTRFGTPTLLIFLIVGMLFGSDGFGIQFNNAVTVQFIGMLALSVILFSGGMETDFKEIKPVATQGVLLATLGVLLTAMLTGFFIYFISGVFHVQLSLPESFLLASVMSSTDSASVFSILRSKKQGLRQNLRPLLELESGSNDPMAYILTIILIQTISQSQIDIWQSVATFCIQMSVGAVAGYLLGHAAVYVLNHINLSNKSLYSVLLLSLVYLIFSLTDLIGGNGYLAVYIAGLVVGNRKMVYRKSLTTFFDGYTWLFQIVMFISLGLLVNPHEMIDVIETGLLVGVFMIVAARPISVFLCLLPFRNITTKGKLYISWVGLRGAVPIIFATYPLVAGIDHAGMIFNTVFFITIISLLVQGTTVSSMANVLGLSVPLKEDSFGIDIPDEIKATLTEREVKREWLTQGNRLKDLALDDKSLVMMIRRDDSYIIPKGDTELLAGDKILCISDDRQTNLPSDYATGGRTFRNHMKKLGFGRKSAKHQTENTANDDTAIFMTPPASGTAMRKEFPDTDSAAYDEDLIGEDITDR